MADVEYGRDITGAEASGDSKTFVKFFKNAFDDEDYIEMRFPVDKNHVHIAKATAEEKRRFPRQWQAYEDNESQIGTDTSVDHVAWLSEADCIRLKSDQIFTLEQLAAMSPEEVPFDIGGERVQKKAIDDVQAKRKASEHDELAANNQAQADVIAKLQERLEALENAKPEARKPRGRPPADNG